MERLPSEDNTEQFLEVYGAAEHNLKNINLKIPRNQLVVITGLSGSGKSSIAFDTIYAEGQRRYLETFSAYARQFIGELKRPQVEKITGLSPVISIEQKSVNKNPRSTVGTITEIYDFLRLLYARIGVAFSFETGKQMVRYSEKQILELIMKKFDGKKIVLLSPLVRRRKGHYRELFEQVRKRGFTKVRVDGELRELIPRMQVDRYKVHDIEVLVDRIRVHEDVRPRLSQSLQTAIKQGKGSVMVLDYEANKTEHYSRSYVCPDTGISYDEPEPNTFSFNSPYGACPHCNGLGTKTEADINKIFPDLGKSIKRNGIAPLGEYKNNWIYGQIEAIAQKFKFSLNTPIKDIPKEAIDIILYGSEETFTVMKEYLGVTSSYTLDFEGIVNYLENHYKNSQSHSIRKWYGKFMETRECPECEGNRLKKESLHFKIDNKSISEVARMDLIQFNEWILDLENKLHKRSLTIAKEIIREIKMRTKFLLDVGLDYLALNRPSRSLSGGESQRIRLATQIGSQLTNVLYILDEPSIGLHQRDNQRLIDSLKSLRDIGNSIIVVEHDEETIRSADQVIDIGPGAGINGGHIVAQGTPGQLHHCETITCQYLSKKKQIKIPKKRRKQNGEILELTGASGHNLKNVTLRIPLGLLSCITGVSGSGKSTLINETLFPILNNHIYHSNREPLAYKEIKGLEKINKVIDIDQSPIGRTPRSNPATYTSVFDEIRKLFTQLPESKIRGYKPGRFSFNVKGGRCETCKGGGLKMIEMNFLPDVYVECEDCNGKRYNRETLEVRYRGKSINDILEMPINEAVEFFENIPSIQKKLKTIEDVGLGYVTLGQQSTTLSGGEAQRIKLAAELSKKDTGQTLYILDEPTTGLHFEDVNVLLGVIQKLVNKGNTVLIIEHNLEVIKVADHIIDLGPEGGDGGGKIIAEGTPEEVAQNNNSYTGNFLKEVLIDQ